MLSIKKYFMFVSVCILIIGCKTVDIPEAYNFRVKETQNNPYGSWMKISLDSAFVADGNYKISGELLAMHPDTSFLLVGDGIVQRIANRNINYAELYTHKNQAGTYMGVAGLYFIPNLIGTIAYISDYGGAFLLIGWPVALTGMIQAIIEASGHKNILMYPGKNPLDQFNLFSRYPAGMPPNINQKELILKKQEVNN